MADGDGRSVPLDARGRSTNPMLSSTDSFKEDIQAIGRAVERLREGFAAGSSDASSKPPPGDDSSPWSRALSSSTAASGTSFACRSEPPAAVGVQSIGEEKQNPQRQSPGAKRRDGSFVDERLAATSTRLETSYSRGHLSLNELRSEDGRGRQSTPKRDSTTRRHRRMRPRADGGGRSPSFGVREDFSRATGANPWLSDIHQIDRPLPVGRLVARNLGMETGFVIDEQAITSRKKPALASTIAQEAEKSRSVMPEGSYGGSDGRSSVHSSTRCSRRRGEGGGGGPDNAKDGGKVVKDNESLIEMRDALRAKEDELSRLKRDVAVVATSSKGIRRLAASLAGVGEIDKEPAPAAVAESAISLGLNLPVIGSIGDKDDDRPASGSLSSLLDGVSRFTGTDGEGGSAVDSAASDGNRQLVGVVQASTQDSGVLHAESEVTRPAKAETKLDVLSSQQMLSQPEEASNASVLAMTSKGSPLVASAYEGLRQMRMVLQEREREAGRAKNNAKKMDDHISDISTRLRASESKRKAQATQIAKAKAELEASRTEAAAEAAHRNASSEQTLAKMTTEALERTAAMRELEDEVVHLKERLRIAFDDLQKEKFSTVQIQGRLDESEREARMFRDRARKAEEELSERAASRARDAGSLAESEEEITSLRTLVDEGRVELGRARAEATAAMTGLRAAEEEGRRQADDAARAREQLRAEKEGSTRISLELEAAIRERMQAVEKLSVAEAETGRLHVELASALASTENSEAVVNERDEAVESVRTAEAELVKLRANLALAREGQETERRRGKQHARRAATLAEELSASEVRRKAQEEDISRTRTQVAKLSNQVEGEKILSVGERTAAAAREARIRLSVEKAEAEVRASREREHETVKNIANLKAELGIGRDDLAKAKAALTAALERANIAEASVQSHARETECARRDAIDAGEIGRHDKETLKRGLVVAQTQTAETRAENTRLALKIERLIAAGSNSSAAMMAASGIGGINSGDESATAAVAAAAEAAVAEAAEAAAKSAVATALEMRRELEERLALAQAEATEARTESQRLKSKLKTMAAMATGRTAPASPSSSDASRAHGYVDSTRHRTEREGEHDGRVSDIGVRIASWESQALPEACVMMDRVASALSDAIDTNETVRSPNEEPGASDLDDPRWASEQRRSSRGGERAFGKWRRRRALSADHSVDGGAMDFSVGRNNDGDGRGERGRDRPLSGEKVQGISERLRFAASRVLAALYEERETAVERLTRLREDLRNSEAREAETTARLEESRELSREQTGFVEGVWQERRRLEAELGARREEVERLRASEDAARTTATILEGRVEDLSSALRKKQARGSRDVRGAEVAAAVAAAGDEAKEAMEVLRRQLDDLRREVEKAKREQARMDSNSRNKCTARGESTCAGHSGRDDVEERSRLSASPEKHINGSNKRSEAAGGAGMASVVLEGEFQRLRAKYEKAKGRIAALDEQVATTRRASVHARREFQGALEALKMSQALLLKIQRDRQAADGGNVTENHTSHESRPNTVAPASTAAQPPSHPQTLGNCAILPGQTQSSPSSSSTARNAAAVPTDTDAHVHELTAQASRLRDMSRSVRGLLQLAAGQVDGALAATDDACLHSAPARHAIRSSSSAAVGSTAATTQTVEGVVEKSAVEGLREQLRVAETVTQALQVEKARLDVELGKASAELAEVRDILGVSNAQVLEMEARIVQFESKERESREEVLAAIDRAKYAESSQSSLRIRLESNERTLSEAKGSLDAAAVTEAELRRRCEELGLASSAFAAEVSRQKEDLAKWQKQSRVASTNASELRKRCADLVRASKTSAAERARLEKELSSARSESQEIDADVAQVLDALASSEQERRRLEGELQRQERVAEEARRAAKAAEGAAADVQKGVDKERALFSQGAGRLEGVVQEGAARLKESLDVETKRRGELELESKALALRVTELEAALISASAEVRKAAKLAADRSTRHEREIAVLNEEATKLRSELDAKSANIREVSERAAEERSKWMQEKIVLQQGAARARDQAALDAAEGAHRDGERERLADVLQRREDETITLRKELGELTQVLRAETTRASAADEASARAVQEAAALTRKLVELEAALEKAKNNVRVADEAAVASKHRVQMLQAEMRSAVTISTTSPPPLRSAAGADREKVGVLQDRRRRAPCDQHESEDLGRRTTHRTLEEEGYETFPAFPSDDNEDVNGRYSGGDFSRARNGAPSLTPADVRPAASVRDADVVSSSSESDKSSARGEGTTVQHQRETRLKSPSAEDEEENAIASRRRMVAAMDDGSDYPYKSSELRRSISRSPQRCKEGPGGEQRNLSSIAEPLSAVFSPMSSKSGEQTASSYSLGSSAVFQSVTTSVMATSGVSSSLQAQVGHTDEFAGDKDKRTGALLPRTGSIVVRNWKIGQQEAFDELDRQASSSSLGIGSRTIVRPCPE